MVILFKLPATVLPCNPEGLFLLHVHLMSTPQEWYTLEASVMLEIHISRVTGLPYYILHMQSLD
jgi:hypothetical protein